jgi:hypothetical protein
MKPFAALGFAACGMLATSRAAEPQPWQLTALRTYSPPYSPNVSLHAGLAFTIADPNTINAGPAHRGVAVFVPSLANCTAQWLDGESPFGRTQACSEVPYGNWTFEVVATNPRYGSWPLQVFGLRITRLYNVTVIANVYTKVYQGEERFEVGGALGGLCGASGICSFQLKNESSPVLIQQKLTACKGEC